MGKSRLADPDRLGQLPLVSDTPGLEIQQNQPHRQRSASLGERLVKRAAHHSGDSGQIQAYRRASGA